MRLHSGYLEGMSTSSLLLLPGPLKLEVVVPVGVSSVGQIDMFKNYLYLIGIFDVISLSAICIKNSYFKLWLFATYYY